MRVLRIGEKRYVFVIVNDDSRFTWTPFLSSKDETFDIFQIFAKLVQKNLNTKLVGIRTDHGIEFENANFLTFLLNMVLIITFLHQELPNKIM